MRLLLAAARKYELVIGMHLLVAISMHLQCSNGNIIHTRATFQIQITAGLSDAVYLIESVVQGYQQEGIIPYCLRGPSSCMRRQK